MPPQRQHPIGLLWIGLLLLIVLAASAVQLMPSQFTSLISLWLMLSLPLGIAIGHVSLHDHASDFFDHLHAR